MSNHSQNHKTMLHSKIKTYAYGIGLFALSLLATRCSDFFEEDLAEETVLLQSPSNNLETEDTNIKFWWDYVDGAGEYNLQVVSPSFSASQSLLLDTVIEENGYSFELLPGKYQWRVCARNSTSQTPFSTYSLSVLIPHDISTTQINIIAPVTGDVLPNSSILFSWEPVEYATGYEIILKRDNWINGTEIYKSNFAVNNFTTTLEDGKYVWGVSAIDSIHQKSTSFSISEFEVDKYGPVPPVLLFPVKDTIINSQELTFIWKSVNEPARYQLSIYDEPSSTNPIISEETQDTTYHITLPKEGKFFWKVRALDKNNNIGAYSNTSGFVFKKDEILTDKILSIILPTNGLIINNSTVTFLWDEVPGANIYHVQVVSPSFESPQRLVYDQWVESNQLELELEGGEYEARILASDGQISTPYTYVHFSKSLFSDRYAQFSFPKDGAQLFKNSITIAWNQTEGATKYHLQIVSPDFNSPKELIYDEWLQENKTILNLSSGFYQARIYASNGNSETHADTVSFEIYSNDLNDVTVDLLNPKDNFVTKHKEITFNWNSIASGLKYLFVLKEGKWESGTTIKSEELNNTSTTMSLSEGNYSWGVKAIDKINNNETSFSIRDFTIDLTPPATPMLVSPAHNTVIDDYSITFSWEDESTTTNKHTYTWELFKVYGNSEALVVSEKTKNKSKGYSINSGGTYRWRVRSTDIAGNTSDYTVKWEVSVPAAVNISNESINLFAPTDLLETTEETHTFWWEKLDGADKYLFQIVSPSFTNIQVLVEEKELTDNKVTLTLQEGTYQWRVKGINTESQTEFTTNTLVIRPMQE